ncbi:hypothetical protein COU20_00340 [Candidatus Kaiserbacteria bacterium CG10_big_fil_rev_8_21_14_0_10_59_10]|uniref:Phosphoribosyltransferase domain-containing protein n=1 Tax=Candidatus Kaiserbacteria bacterium CG10_big_fil_rev_8_21_14_0_10_59_10 TaxID=1974612 RepID=A0A2H0UAP3_9BACT|nr:MAG: hypothetical protein COU20_00340 [Candidatus Kaiserbacteria bacterium CG10_big_fil_rev_8_21_14_0_10_59_10]
MNMRASLSAAAALLETALDMVLPRRERSLRAARYGADDLAPEPAIHFAFGREIATLFAYRRGAVEDAIRALKYDRSAPAATLLADALAGYLFEELADLRRFSARRTLLVPVPLHGARARVRGYNQVECVLERLPAELRNGSLSRYAPEALARTRDTLPQTRLTRDARLKNVAGAFAVPSAALVEGAHILLIDDVTTTGATLLEAARPLERAGATVSLFALAHA